MNESVYLFAEAPADDRLLLGNKGANLARMTSLGLPVPPGFIIPTTICRAYFEHGNALPSGLMEDVHGALRRLEAQTGKRLGDRSNPLLLSVRSGAPVSMPGMMDTVLNLGINDAVAEGLAQRTGNPRFAYDCHRRFLQMFGTVVLGVEAERYETLLDAAKERKGYSADTDLTAEDLKALIAEFKGVAPVPEDPDVQLEQAIGAVFSSWFTPRAVRYREFNAIGGDMGTAVNVQTMVFGNMGDTSGTGVAFTRSPATGENRFYGEYLPNAEGEDVVAGVRTPLSLEALQASMPEVYAELDRIQRALEAHYRDMQDLEFTIEDGRLYILQTRTGKRTAKAAMRIAVDMVREGRITEQEALLRIESAQLAAALHPVIDPDVPHTVLAHGLPASPGAATGKVVFTADEAERLAAQGEAVVMVRRQTTPEDIHGMHAAVGILTQLGGMTSHAAVVARGMGKCCVAGCAEIAIDYERERFTSAGGHVVHKLDVITLDGTAGEVLLGDVPKLEALADENFQTLLDWADRFRRLSVRANAETEEDARKARELGAEGIGLARTEHMFFAADRIDVMRAMILSESDGERAETLERLSAFQKADMKALFHVMDGLPVTVRLLDPPLHEFLPGDEADRRALAERLGKPYDWVRARMAELSEANPMLGFRGCRLSIIHPEITRMQVRAIVQAAVEAQREGCRTHPEIMVPLVTSVMELRVITDAIRRVIAETLKEMDAMVDVRVGTMIEVPRACLRAAEIAPLVDFYSFGTNDLTQMVFGFSRDDVRLFLATYLNQKVIRNDPFVTLDQRGVGSMMRHAIEISQPANPHLEYGICGEHGGDPRSVQFFHRIGLDYVSCSPYRVPAARIAAAQAAVADAPPAQAAVPMP